MLVDVVRLRRAGQKIPDVELKSASGARGYLRFSGWRDRDGIRTEASLHGTESPGSPAEARLLDAQLKKIKGDSLLFHGRDEDGHPQAWWCKLVSRPA